MTTRSAADVQRLAFELGHGDIDVHRTRSGWSYSCLCGFVSKPLFLQSEIVKLATRHIVDSVAEVDRFARAHGISWESAFGELVADPVDIAMRMHLRSESRGEAV